MPGIDSRKLPLHQRCRSDWEPEFGSVGELFRSRAAAGRDRPCIIAPGIRTETLTWRELEIRVNQARARLRSRGLARGDRLCILFPNGVEFVTLYLAALSEGVVAVPVNPDLAPDEMGYILADSGAMLLVYAEPLTAKAAKAATTAPRADCLSWNGFIGGGNSTASPAQIVESTDTAVIIYTSGTTGKPKGVVLTHLNLLADAWAIADRFKFNSGTRTLCLLPLFHNNGQVVTLLAPLTAGGSTVIVPGKVSLLSFWDLVERHGVNWTSVMPAILAVLLQHRERFNGAALQGVICGGQVLKRSVQEQFETAFGTPVFEGYGLTETTSFATFNEFPAERRRAGSIGTPLPVCEVAVLDVTGGEPPTGEEGELCIRGLNVAGEYLGLPERNRKAFTGGWFHSGDYGHRDADGWFHFHGRRDDLIIKGGENIYPAEVENLLLQHTTVAECAVVGVPHPLLGEEICAFVKLSDARVTESELKEYCRGRIAPFKVPREILVVNRLADLDDIPRGPTQKILYRELRDYYRKLKGAAAGGETRSDAA